MHIGKLLELVKEYNNKTYEMMKIKPGDVEPKIFNIENPYYQIDGNT